MPSLQKSFFLIVVLSFVFLKANAQKGINFVENKNQWEPNILYKADLDGGSLFLEKNKLTFSFYDKELIRSFHGASEEQIKAKQSQKLKSHAFQIDFINSAFKTTTGSKVQSDYNNYFIGNDKKKWASNVKKFGEIVYQNLYNGIDLEIIGLSNSIKYNFYVKPNVNPDLIQLQYKGVDSIFLDKGQLNIVTNLGTILEQEPFAYQFVEGKKIKIPCQFVLKNKTLSFKLGAYNKNYELVIDPILVFCSYSGSTADNFGTTATPDNFGNLIAGGIAFDNGYPTSVGAYDITYNGFVQGGHCDVVITKYNSTGTDLLFSTYLGGAGTENVNSLIVNKQNELFLYGVTGSANFPISTTAFDATFNGGTAVSLGSQGNYFSDGTDIYVAKFSSDGNTLLASTYVGGTANDGLNISANLQYNYGDALRGEIMLDKYGEVYVASSTNSYDFPVTTGAFNTAYYGNYDGCVFKMDVALSSLIWSAFLGGSQNDAAFSVAVNDSLQAFICGGTNSPDFPTTANVLNTSFKGGISDGFITIINADASQILKSTYIGTSKYDQNYFIQIDKQSNPYVLGQTEDYTGFPTTTGVYKNDSSGIFISKLDYNLTSYTYSTLAGSRSLKVDLSPTAFLIDNCETIYFSGWGGKLSGNTPTINMPLTPNAKQSTTDGYNFYLMRLEKDAAALNYATYFGGNISREHVDGGTSRFDKKGVVYQSVCAGCTNNDDFPTTPNAWSRENKSTNCNNGVFKFDFEQTNVSANISSQSFRGCSPFTIQLFNSSSGFTSYLWDFGNNDTTSQVLNPIKTYNAPGLYQVKLIVENPLSCNVKDTTINYIEVLQPLNVDFDFLVTDCQTNVTFVDQTTGSDPSTLSYLWDFGNGITSDIQQPNTDFEIAGNFNVKLVVSSSLGCADSVEVNLDLGKTSITADTILCKPGLLQFFASGGMEYTWEPKEKLNDNKIANPIATINETTSFTCVIKTADSGGNPCVVNSSVFVQLSPIFKINITSSADTVIENKTVQLNAEPVGDYIYSWSPIQTLSNYKIPNPIASPLQTTDYKIKIADYLGCVKDTTIKIVVIDVQCVEPYVFIPNTFTPNQDGENDEFKVRGKYIYEEEFYLAIYNRWGELLFESNSPNLGWNGTFKDKKLDPDVYAYYVKLKCVNGEEYFKKGNVTLIR